MSQMRVDFYGLNAPIPSRKLAAQLYKLNFRYLIATDLSQRGEENAHLLAKVEVDV